MLDDIHYFQEFDNINIEHGHVSYSTTASILCGATSGEADNRKNAVTCDECKKILKAKERPSCR